VPEQPYPVFEKNGLTQIAPNAAAEIRLRFNGWRKVEQPEPAAPAADPADPGGSPPAKPKPRTKPADQ
jgi:hypothetical protein